ncbi:hypothetical protein GCM10010124_40180 [Pilimelia terevasa]|uniref:Protein arginine N-methyltransferase 1 n=1 Tax=Pilimelia terevasa TaxID=53372 RepID=A0A8J3BVT3_9ACTN|nr:class I SAM-dependent methyltransferase [Pilimelia terevasa]GGK43377.1 hypothetical protein GCM10010124_40180 [Pilimelia terevasa]
MPETHYIEGSGWRTGVLVDPDPRPVTAPKLMPTHGEYPIYDATLYDPMTTDTERTWRFREALERYAPDRVVLDIGTGSYLFWARESLRAGAGRVIAMETMQGSYDAASRALESLDDGDRVTLLHGESTTLVIEQKAELCVAEIIGSLASAEGAAAVLADAKRRHLTPDAAIIPDVCSTRAAAVSFAGLFAGRVPAFSPDALPQLQRIFDWNGGPFDVRLRIADPAPDGIMSDHAAVERLEFNGNLRAEQASQVRLTIDRPGVADGILTWLVIQCLPDQKPLDALRDQTNWASIYLPLFDTGVPVTAGDTVDLSFGSVLSEDGVHPDYHISAELRTAHGVHRAEHASLYQRGGRHSHPLYRTLLP